MKTLTVTDDGARVVEPGAKDSEGRDTETVWSLDPDQSEKHRPQFAAEVAALSVADRKKLDDRRDAMAAAKGAR